MELGNAYVNIIPSAEGIGSNIANVLKGDSVSAGAMAGEQSGFAFAGKLMDAINGSGVVDGLKYMFAEIGNTGSYLDTIDKTSQKLGIQADQYQALSFMAEHCGVSTGIFKTAINKLQASGYDGTLTDFLDSLMEIDDVTERTAKAHEVLGDKVANEMAPYINGSKSISDYRDELESLGNLMSDDAVKAGAEYQDMLINMNTSIDGIKNNIFSAFLPAMSSVFDGLSMIFSGNGGGVEKIASGIMSFVGTLGETFVNLVVGAIGFISNDLPQLIEAGKGMVNDLMKGLKENLPEIIAQGTEMINSLLSGLGDSAGSLLEFGGQLVLDLINGLIANAPALIGGALQLIMSLGQGLVGMAVNLIPVGGRLLVNLGIGLIQAVPQLLGKIPQIISRMGQAFTNTNWGKVGKDVINGIAKGISAAKDAVWNALKKACDFGLSKVKKFLGIASPSRVFAKEVGQWIPKGMAMGIDNNTQYVTKSVGDMATASLKGMDGVTMKGNSLEDKLDELKQAFIVGSKLYINGREFAYATAGDMNTALTDRERMNNALRGVR